MDGIGIQGIGLLIMHAYALAWILVYAAVFAVGTLWLLALGSLAWNRQAP